MFNLFKRNKPAKAERVYKVEILGEKKDIISKLRATEGNKKYITCLCLPGKKKETHTHDSLCSAMEQMWNWKLKYTSKREILGW